VIKINLATRKQSASAATAGGALGGFQLPAGLSKMNINISDIRDLPIRRFVLPLVVAIVATYVADGLKEDELAKVQAELAGLNEQTTKLQAEAGKLRGYEELKKNMEADEQMMRTKLGVVQALIQDRANPPKVMRSLAAAMPKDVWLSEFRAGEKEVSFKGFSLDFNQVSDFMKNLSESAYFADVTIKNTQQAKDELGMDVASFDLSARRR
jgi:Tfp pilus assembly protein PilN